MLRAHVSRRIGPLALDATLEVERGMVLALVGESGSGETTLLRLIAGLEQPDAGRVEVDGEVWADTAVGMHVPVERRPLGWVAQDYAVFPHLSALENIAFGLRASGVAARGARSQAAAALARVGLGDAAARRPAHLSGGEQQRVALARALVLRPRLLLLDEPFGALDPSTRQAMRRLLRALVAEDQVTTVCVTHSPLEALAIGERIAVLERGRIIQEGTAAELLRRPRSPVVARFLGINCFRGTIGRRDGAGLVEIRTESGTIAAVDPGGDAEVLATVDPRDIVVALDAPSGSARNVFRGAVAEISPEPPAGERVRVALDTEPPLVAEVTAEAVAALGLRVGMPVFAAFKATGVTPYR